MIIASLLTVALCGGLIAYATYTKTDFTIMGGMLFVLCFMFLFCSVLSMFFVSRILEILLLGFGLFLFSAYLIYDVQLIADGGHERHRSFSTDDYIRAAMNIYLDIVIIFIEILKLIGKLKEKD